MRFIRSVPFDAIRSSPANLTRTEIPTVTSAFSAILLSFPSLLRSTGQPFADTSAQAGKDIAMQAPWWDTVCVVSLLEIHLYFIVIPLGLVAVLALLIWSGKKLHPETYKLSEPWTHPPILWAATDEAVGDAHGHGEHGAGHFTVGGGASGTW